MTLQRLLLGITVTAGSLVPALVTAQIGPAERALHLEGQPPLKPRAQAALDREAQPTPDTVTVDVEQFRESLLVYALSVREASLRSERFVHESPQERLIEQVANLNVDQLELWLSYLPDPARYVQLLEMSATEFVGPVDVNRDEEAIPQGRGGGVDVFDPFPPDYPPNSGRYGGYLLTQLQTQGLVSGSNRNQQRCNITEWANRYEFWEISKSVADGLEEGCVIGGCDPTGIACGIGCAIFVAADIVATAAAVPITECDAHIGNVDSAEIEAAFRNTVTIIEQGNARMDDAAANHAEVVASFNAVDLRFVQTLNALLAQDAALAAHDTDIKSAILSHDTDVKSVVLLHDSDVKSALSLHDAELKSALAVHHSGITTQLAVHHSAISTQVATHDTDIKNLLATLQASVDANSAKLDLLLARQLEVVRLLHTPEGQRRTDVPACDGAPCTFPNR